MATIYIDADTRKAIANISKLEKEFSSFSKSADQDIKKVTSGMKLLKIAGAGLAGVFAIGAIKDFTGQLIGLADTYTNIDSKLKLVTDSQEEFAQTYKELYELGKDTGSQLEVNAQSFSKLANAMPDAEAKELVGYLETVNKSLATSGVEAQEASAFMLQWSQAMGSGVVAGDELKSMVESNSYLMQKMAKSILGPTGTISALKEMGSEGKLTSELFAKHLGNVSEEINKDFSEMGKTVTRAWNEVTETFKSIFADANKGAGGTAELAEQISRLATTIEENRDGIISLFTAMIEAGAGAVNVIGNIGQSIQALSKVKSGEISFLDYMLSDAEDLKVLLAQVRAEQSDMAVQEEKLQSLLAKRSELESQQGGILGGIFGDSSIVVMELKEIDEQIEKTRLNIGKEKIKLEVENSEAKQGLQEIEDTVKETAEASEKAWEKYVEKAKKLNQEIVDDFKSISEEIRDIQREGMSDQGQWDDVLKQIGEYEKLAKKAADAGEWEKQKSILSDIAGLYKSLPKEGVKGAAPSEKELADTKKNLEYWQKIRKEQTTFSGAYTYDIKVKEAAEALKQLQAQEKAGGKDLITAEQSRKTRLDGLKAVQEEMLVLNERLTESVKDQAGEMLKITDSFSGDQLDSGKKALNDMTTATVEVGEAFKDVGGVWTEVGDVMAKEMENHIEYVHEAQEAIDDYIKDLEKALRLGSKVGKSSSSGENVSGYAVGGVIPGFGGTDSILAKLTPGEGVLSPIGMSVVGRDGLSQLNAGRNPFQSEGENVNLSFVFNDKTVGSLAGERRSVQKIINQFSDMRRSLS